MVEMIMIDHSKLKLLVPRRHELLERKAQLTDEIEQKLRFAYENLDGVLFNEHEHVDCFDNVNRPMPIKIVSVDDSYSYYNVPGFWRPPKSVFAGSKDILDVLCSQGLLHSWIEDTLKYRESLINSQRLVLGKTIADLDIAIRNIDKEVIDNEFEIMSIATNLVKQYAQKGHNLFIIRTCGYFYPINVDDIASSTYLWPKYSKEHNTIINCVSTYSVD